jgi:hypothetical protein
MLSTRCEKPINKHKFFQKWHRDVCVSVVIVKFVVCGKGGGKNEISCPPLDRIPATFIIMELKKKIPGSDETCSANSLQILDRVCL